MYVVREKNKKSLVERAKEEHNINTSLLEGYETENIFKKSFIVENLDFNEVDKYEKIDCVLCFLELHIILMTSFIYSCQNIILYPR